VKNSVERPRGWPKKPRGGEPGRGWSVSLEERSEKSFVELGVEDGDSQSFGGEDVRVGLRDPLDEAVEAEAGQVVGHLVGCVLPPEQPGHQPAKALVGEAGDGVDEHDEGAGQGHGAWVPEAQGSGSLALPYVGLVDALEERRADGTALTGTFDHKQTTVDGAGLDDEFG